MGIKIKIPALWWITYLGLFASFAAANDMRLVEAVEAGNNGAVRSLLKQHVDVNASQGDGATALAWAAYRDDQETLDLLINAGANVNAANDYGITPLALACANGSPLFVDKLLKAGANPKAAAWAGETVLMRCSRTGNVQAVKSLLARGADPNAKEARHEQTALMWAVAQRHAEVVRALIDHGADVRARSKTGFTPLLFASQQGDMDSARLLLAAGANVNEATINGDTPLLMASLNGHEALSIFLLDRGADPNAAERNGITALHYAVLAGLVRIAGIDTHLMSIYAPYLYRPNMVELVKALLAHGANPNARLVAPAVPNDNTVGYGKIMALLTPPPGVASPVGATPFFLAALTFDTNLMRILVAGGADPLLATEENISPLMVAAGLGQESNDKGPLSEEQETKALEAVKLAVQLGADVNAANNLGMTALHGAAFRGSNRIIQFLVEMGANLNAKDQAGQTPLHKAANIVPTGVVAFNLIPYVTRKSTVELLLSLGAAPVTAALDVGAASNRKASAQK